MGQAPRDIARRDELSFGLLAVLVNGAVIFRSHYPFAWRGAGVVELAALEMLWTGNRTVGSNPTLSAIMIFEQPPFAIVGRLRLS